VKGRGREAEARHCRGGRLRRRRGSARRAWRATADDRGDGGQPGAWGEGGPGRGTGAAGTGVVAGGVGEWWRGG
jgi:hypothetical protein